MSKFRPVKYIGTIHHVESMAFALKQNCLLKAFYIPGKENKEADWASRFFKDGSDWQLNPLVFQELAVRFGPFSIDLFASHLNSQLPYFFSWLPDPKANAVDAFSQVWPQQGAYASLRSASLDVI
jgi:hypothetical protein